MAGLCASSDARSTLFPYPPYSSEFRYAWCRYSHRVAVVIALRIRSGSALRSAIALALLPPPTPKAPKIIPQEVICTYHQQVRILKPLSRCLSGGLESRCAAAVNSASLGYVSSARAVRHSSDGAGALLTLDISTSPQQAMSASFLSAVQNQRVDCMETKFLPEHGFARLLII